MADDTPVLDQVNIITGDMRRSVDFYRRLGAEFAPVWNTGWAGRSDLQGRVVLGFRIATRDGVDQRFGSLTSAGYRELQPPFDAFWGARYAIVEDPDGIPIGLMSPIDPARRTPPPKD